MAPSEGAGDEFDEGNVNGTNLDLATQEFLDETRNTRVLQMQPNSSGEFALTVMNFVEYLGIELDLEVRVSFCWSRLNSTRNPSFVSIFRAFCRILKLITGYK